MAMSWRSRQPTSGATERDAAARLFEENLGLVHMVVRELRSRATPGFDVEDMVQEGMLGLLHAVRNWDGSRGVRFSSYAVPCIRGAIRNAREAKAAPVRVPRRVVALAPISLDVRDADDRTLADRLPDIAAVDPATSAATADLAQRLGQVLSTLDPLPREVVVRRYGLDGGLPLRADHVARQLGITTDRTRKLEAEVLAHLRSHRGFE
jgi:RNA polymerase sigma factor (sigma-70 family)